MVTRFLLIRHATCDPTGVTIAGRAAGIYLNTQGLVEADALARRLVAVRLDAIYASPLERARATAECIARPRGLSVQELGDVTEVHFGDWTGQSLASLDATVEWHHFNTFRSGARIPGGESVAEVQHRALRAVEQLCCRHPGATVAVVSHADIIRPVLAWFAGIPIDLAHRLEIAPASVSILELAEWGPRLVRLNDTGPLHA